MKYFSGQGIYIFTVSECFVGLIFRTLNYHLVTVIWTSCSAHSGGLAAVAGWSGVSNRLSHLLVPHGSSEYCKNMMK